MKEVGRERAIKDFTDINGSWVRGDVYIFAQSFNGTTLVLPYLPNAVGTNRLNNQDPEGRYINREMSCIALHGSGYYRYTYKNPITNITQKKMSYVSKVDDNWWLGAGIFYNNSALNAKSNSVSTNSFPVDGELMWKFVQAENVVLDNFDQDKYGSGRSLPFSVQDRP